jgi:hypothetical protein
MGFLDKAKQAANDLAAKADSAIAGSGLGGPGPSASDAERHLRDLGVLAYLEATGRPASTEDRVRIVTALQAMEPAGVVNLGLRTSAVPPPAPSAPPPPGAAAAAQQAPPPPPPPTAGEQPSPPAPATAPPPPPPSWAKDGD